MAANPTKTMKNLKFLCCAAVVAAAVSAHADIIPTLDSITPGSGTFDWNYTANVTADEMVVTGDYFTIYDFQGLIVGSNQQPADWTFSTSLTGVTPSTTNPQDDPTIPNLTWTYVGTETLVGPQPLGTFTVSTTTNLMGTDNFTASATRSNGPNAGTDVDNIGTVAVPVPEMSSFLPMIGVCGIGVAGMATRMLRRRRSA